MKILYIINDLNIRGGTHKQLLKLLEYTEKSNIDFSVMTYHLDYTSTYPEFSRYQKKIILFPPTRPWYLKIKGIRKYYSKKYLSAYLRRLARKYDVINIHDNGLENILPFLPSNKVVWQINDLPYYPDDKKRNNSTPDELLLEIKRNFENNLNHADKITVNVSKNAERLKRYYGRDAHVYYCGIEPIKISRNNENTFIRFSQKKIHLLSSGVFFEYRNYETQIKVVEQLRKDGYDVELHIIGETKRAPDYVEKIKRLIIEKQLQRNIFIEGQVDESQFKKLHLDADVFLFINIDQSWGLAVFEAMSCGLPVIVSTSVGATEVLHNGKDAIFVEPTDVAYIVNCIKRLVSEKEHYTTISSNASEYAKTMTWDDTYCSKMINLMSSLTVNSTN